MQLAVGAQQGLQVRLGVALIIHPLLEPGCWHPPAQEAWFTIEYFWELTLLHKEPALSKLRSYECGRKGCIPDLRLCSSSAHTFSQAAGTHPHCSWLISE